MRSGVKRLQWSRPQLRTETWSVIACRCPDSELQWSRPQLRTETTPLPPWSAILQRTSMEPSSVEDGNVGDFGGIYVQRVTSMEPSSVEDGNPPPAGPFSSMLTVLQWSRPQLRTETAGASGLEDAGWYTSMEPSSVEDGNSNLQSICRRCHNQLQWSRPQLRTETCNR